MEIFELMKNHNQEQIAFYTDKSVKLRAMLAINSTALGPAIGGIRIYGYKSQEEALFDLCRLSQTMTYKTAAAGVNFGGGQIVVIDQPGMERNEPLFRALGRFIESFKGRIIAGEDMGVTEDFMEYMKMETQYLTGLPAYYGGSGNPSYMCTLGALKGLMAAAKYRWGTGDIGGKTIIIQGYGRTGSGLALLAKEKGARVKVADIDPGKVARAQADGFEILPPASIYTEKCDILAPCAIGPIIDPGTAETFQCEIIAGTANNQLLNPDDDLLLKKRNILYAPDFIINAGAAIDVAEEYQGYMKEKVKRKIESIYDRLLEIFKTADEQGISYNQAAIGYAKRRIESVKKIKWSATTS